MQVGDLVRRKNIWHKWEKHNGWMRNEEYSEIGIIVEWQGSLNRFVLWPQSGLSWEDEDELEVLDEDVR